MKPRANRRTVLKSAAGAAGSLLLSAIPSPAATRTQKHLRIGYLPITDASPLLIAHANGYFADEGLRAEQPIMIRSWSTLSESFLTGKFDVTHMLLPIPIWLRFKNKAPVKILAWDHTNGSAITVRGGTGIDGFADLGGRQIAVPYWYSMHNIILQMGIRRAGLTPVIQPSSAPLGPDKVNLFILSPPEMPAALAGRKIDGFIVAEPFNALAEMKINAKIMRFTGDIWKNHPCCVVVMLERYLRDDPVFTQKVVNAIVEAQHWITHNPERAAAILSKEGRQYLPVPKKVLLRVFGKYDLETYGPGNHPAAIRHPEWRARRIAFQPYPYPSATRFITRAMSETVMEGNHDFLKRLDPEYVARTIVDDRFVRKALRTKGDNEFFPLDYGDPWRREEIIRFNREQGIV